MSDLPSRKAIVTVNSLPLPSQMESTSAPDTESDVDPLERALLMNRYRALRRRLEAEAALAGNDVLITAQDPEVSRLQSRLAELAVEGQELGPGGQEVKFGAGFGGRDWFGWLKSTLDWVDRKEAHPFIWSTAAAEVVPDTLSMAIMGDWGTALYGAPKIAENIKAKGPFDVLMHLGDVYYSGTADETKNRFIAPWPFTAGKISRTLNANHEMYSGGYGYFDIALPRFGQKASYFALQNANWLLVGLDTAYVDHDMDPRQVDWLTATIAAAGSRKVVLFSHQQLFSRLDDQGVKLEAKLRGLLEKKRLTAWYWGHEHQCVLYDKHPAWNLTARCLGNGGIPEPRKREVLQAPVEITKGPVTWKRLAPLAEKPWAPSCLALDGANPDVKGRENDFVPHSYMTLHFEGPVLKERVQLPDGTLIFENEIS
jgi:hypothetical protein